MNNDGGVCINYRQETTKTLTAMLTSVRLTSDDDEPVMTPNVRKRLKYK